jgi:RNA ligase (TIGR02306 family)
MSENKRKLVTVRQIDNLEPIDGADAIEVATIEGWKVVVKKGEFKVGEQCVYFEIDSFLPEGNPAWQFLVDKQGREFEGVRGHRLRTIKLRGVLSQGLALPITSLLKVVEVDGKRYIDLSDHKVARTDENLQNYQSNQL